jgi:hypothetical protein
MAIILTQTFAFTNLLRGPSQAPLVVNQAKLYFWPFLFTQIKLSAVYISAIALLLRVRTKNNVASTKNHPALNRLF